MTRPITPAAAMFNGAHGNTLVGDVYGEDGPPVLLLHGGGQTRHAWRKTGDLIARMGRDRLRGRSARPRRFRLGRRRRLPVRRFCRRCPGAGRYAGRAERRAAGRDRRLARRHRGAARQERSAGSAKAQGNARQASISRRWCWSTSRRASMSKASSKIQGFMRAQLREGFASIEEAADAVAAYLPHRPRPRSHEGLKKNLRLHPDGRWRWHWDPRFLEGNRRIGAGSHESNSALIDGGQERQHSGAAGARRLLGTGAGGARQGFSRARAACDLCRCQRRPPHGRRRPQRSVRKRN